MKNLNLYAKLHLLLSVFFALSVISCSKDDDSGNPDIVNNVPGQIPGLGLASGTPTGTSFTLPTGVTYEGNITGAYENNSRSTYAATEKQNILKKEGKPVSFRSALAVNADQFRVGNGMHVEIKFQLKNSTSSAINVPFPAGLIAFAKSGKPQNGILLKKTSVTIPANKTIAVNMVMYCGNLTRTYPMYNTEIFEFLVVSNSSLILDLCDRLKNKAINIEEYNGKDVSYLSPYYNYSTTVQAILWKLTDLGEAISEIDIENINKIPDSKD